MPTRNAKVPAVDFVKAKKAENPALTTVQLRAFLIAEGYASKDVEANAILRESGLAGKRGRSGFRDVLYARLVEGPLTEAEFNKMLAGQSNNVIAHTKHYWAIVCLANEVRANVEAAKGKAA